MVFLKSSRKSVNGKNSSESGEKHMTKKGSKHAKKRVTAEHETKHSTPKKDPVKFPWVSVLIVLIITIAIIVLIVKSVSDGSSDNGKISPEDKVTVEFYVMSQCPYGTQVEDAFAPVLEEIGEAINFHLDFIVSESSPGVFQSLHKEPEVVGDKAQLCAMKYYPDDYQYMDLIICQNKDATNIATNWEGCASQNSMDSSKLKTCIEENPCKDHN